MLCNVMRFFTAFLLLIILTNTHILAAPDIIGGQLIKSSDFPGIIKYEFQNLDKNLFECTGAFIASNIILTAAHCLVKLDQHETQEVQLDSIKILGFPDLVVNKIEYLDDFLDPPSLNSKGEWQRLLNSRYDIAYMVLSRNVDIAPLKISFKTPDYNNKFRLVSFGRSNIASFTDEKSGKKQSAFFSITNPYTVGPHISQVSTYEFQNQLQVISQIQPGDSGGPLLNKDNEIIGIASKYSLTNIFDDSGYLKGHKLQSYFTPLHKKSSFNFLKSILHNQEN